MDGYHRLRRESSLVEDGACHLEGTRWKFESGKISRKSGDWALSVYRADGDIEACLVAPDGTVKTYS